MTSLSSFISSFLSNPLGVMSSQLFQIYQLSFFAILIFVLIGIRIALSAIGRKYSNTRLFLGPLFLALLVAYNYYNSYVVSISLSISSIMSLDILTVPFFVVLGIFAGHKLAKRDRVFTKKGKPHYRSSIAISLVWALSFLIRMGMITLIPGVPVPVGLLPSVILDLTTGLILGEAIKIHGTYIKEYMSGTGAVQ